MSRNDHPLSDAERLEQSSWDQLVEMLLGPRLAGDRLSVRNRDAQMLAISALRAAGRVDLAEQLA